MRRLLPSPLFSLLLLAMWLLLNQSVSAGQVVLGTVLALGGGLLLKAVQPAGGRVRNPLAAMLLAWRVLIDIVESNIEVARIVLGPRACRVRAGFVEIPLALKSRYGLALLACIVTATPGTAWVNYNPSTGSLLLHVLDIDTAEIVIGAVKQRYESLLLEIFG